VGRKSGGKFHLKLNMGEKYLEKGVKRLEIVGAEAVEIYSSRSTLCKVERQDGVA
jgi:hypothetical protein